MRFPTQAIGVRPPTEHGVDRPEVYSSNAQPTGTNRPRACLTNPQPKPQKHTPQFLARVHTHISTPKTKHPPQTRHTGRGRVHRVTAAIATGKHPDPYRTRKLSLPAPMVLQPRGCGRVGRRRTYTAWEATQLGALPLLFR